MNFPILRTDPDFIFLIQPTTQKYKDRLEEYIVDNGCPEYITIWDDVILDGHIRYNICKEWSIPFRVKSVEFNDRNLAISFICRTQLNRTDLTIEYRRYLIGKLFISECSYAKKLSSINSQPEERSNVYRTTDIAVRLGTEFYMSYGTINKFFRYAKAIDKISEKSPDLARHILMNEIKMSQENAILLSSVSEIETRYVNEYLSEQKIDHISDSDIWSIISLRSMRKASPKKKQIKNSDIPKIRKTPKYDPEAPLASLKYTSISWIDSINRAIEKTEFEKISDETKILLITNLSNLTEVINKILALLKEDDNNARPE